MHNNISEILERFYILTNLSIIAINVEGEIIASSGYDIRLDNLFKENNIWNKLVEKFESLENYNFAKILTSNGINYTACLVEPNNIQRGIYVLGPHSCKKDNPVSIPYKPRCLMGNLISLLYIISKEINEGMYSRKFYSFHVKKALDYIEANYNKEISLQDVADYLNINKSYLCTLLKKEIGRTFTNIINEVRIDRSKKLIMDTNASILEVALGVGFNNQNYFNIMFKKFTGLTPMEYRVSGE